jgi:hypothetical protein
VTAEAATADRARERWSSKPRAAFAIRTAAAVTPIAVSVVFVAIISRIVDRPSGLLETVVWWALLTGASTVVLVAVERGMRRFLPLAALFKMSLAFPDQAPSRYKAAMRTRTLRQLQRGLEEGQLPETAVGEQESAERLLALAMALNDHDRMTRGHTERVRAYTLMIGEEMGLPEADLDRLHWAGLVHDIGKLEVPPELLNKPGRPSDDEWQIIKQHPDAGFRLVEPLRPWLGEWADAASQHHERWDGKGYPVGLSGTEMSLSGRIVAVADAYDVMTSVRSYKTAMSPAEARAELARCAGTQFDPEVVRAFLNISIGRLRLVMGPLSWLAEFPLLGRMPVGAAGTAVSSLAAMTVAVIAGLTGHAPHTTHQDAAPRAEVQLATASPPPTSRTTVPRVIAFPPSTTTPTTSTSTTSTTSTTTTLPAAPAPPAPPAAPPADAVVNGPPIASDTSVSTDEDTPVTIDLSALVSDPDGDALTVSVPGSPSLGHVSVDGLLLDYTPDPNANGSDSFTYSVEDPSGGSASASVTVTVAAVNDLPSGGTIDVTTDEDTPITVDLSSAVSDVDGDALSIATVGSAAHGAATANGPLGVDYSPGAQFHGSDQFTVQVTDPDGAPATVTVSVTVASVNDAPVGGTMNLTTNEDTLLAVDLSGAVSDVDGDPLSITSVGSAPHGGTAANGTLGVNYVPVADFHGADQFAVQVSDPGGLTATVTVHVTVTPVNDAPTALDTTVLTNEDQAATIDLSTVVDDIDGDSLSLSALGTPSQGQADASGLTVTYTPDSDTNGTDSFTYTVTDPTGATASGTVTVDVTPVPDAPVAQDDAFVADPVLPLSEPAGALLANDFDVDGDTVTVVPGLTLQGLGVVSVNPDGSFLYTAPLLFSGTDSFTYTVTDGSLTATATVTITVNAAATTGVSYLTPTPSATAGWTLAGSPPPASEPEADTGDGDTKPGTTLHHTDKGLAENAPDHFQLWSQTMTSDTHLDGPVTLDLWSMVHDGEPKKAHLYAWLFDCSGGSCTQLLASDYFADPWNPRNTWTEHPIVLGSLDTTIAAGHDLRLRIQFDNDDMWIAQSGGRPSSLTITTG